MKNNRVYIDPVSLTLDCLRQIYVADKTSTKQVATDLLSFIHIVSQVDMNAPFAKADPTEVFALTKREIYGKFDHEFKGKFNEEFIEEAAQAYQAAFDSAENAAVRVYDNKIHEINRIIADTKIQIREVAVRGGTDFISNFPIINKMMQDMTKINAAKEALRSAIMKQKSTNTVRGQKQVSFLEKRRAEMVKAGVIKAKEDDQPDEENMSSPPPTDNF